jgi:putative inorganic carbon (HCO3(-)) transporter
MYSDKIKSLYPTAVLITVLLCVSLGITYMLVNAGTIVAPAVVGAILGISLLAAVIRDYRVGFYALFTMGVFMFYVDRLVSVNFPLGTLYDGLGALTFLAIFLNSNNKTDWTLFRNPITITFLIITIYQILQVVNPSAVSRVAWLVAMRTNTSILLFIVCFQMFATLNDVKRFTTFWLTISFIVGAYGCYQEWIGLPNFEMNWITSNPERFKLYFIWGNMRKFSFLSDPSAFGLFAAMGGLACLVLAMGPFKTSFRVLMAFCGMLQLVSMSYSGTRTAIAMVAVGIVFYILLTLRNRNTIIASVIAVFFGVILIFGPFYGSTANRIRSTFNPDKDPSMVIRDQKRIRLQKYVLSHPIGGGLYTTGVNGLRYSAGHELAQGWDADSGYLLIGLELGSIGLVLFFVFFFLVILKGINNYFYIDDPLLKTLNLAYLVPVMALSVAHYTQDAMFTKPMNMVVIAAYAVMLRIPTFEKKLYSVDLV